jgi:signal transduction histidine kinase
MDAHETERARIARDLHDDLGQRVAGLTMMLYSFVDGLRADSAQTHTKFLQLCNQFTELGRDISAISHRLHPSLLDLRGLARAAASLCKETAEQYKVCVDFADEDVPQTLPRQITLGMFRVLQEALTNAVKHSGSERIEVTLRGGAQGLRLEVADHGVGFNSTSAAGATGLGLLTMRERLILMNGELTIDSRAGVGTRLTAVVPIESDGEDVQPMSIPSAVGQFARS